MIVLDAGAPGWAQRLAEEIKRALEKVAADPPHLKVYSTASLPPAARLAGRAVLVAETMRPAYSDGATWRYFANDTAV